MRSKWTTSDNIGHILAFLMPANRLAIEMSLRYGMRIGDVLSVRTEQAVKGAFGYKEEKTGKNRRIKLSKSMQEALLGQAGKIYVFEHRTDWRKHRTRQAVYKDIKRISKALRLDGISPHTARKIYAVERYNDCGDMKRVQKLLNHSNEAVTMIYALADKIK